MCAMLEEMIPCPHGIGGRVEICLLRPRTSGTWVCEMVCSTASSLLVFGRHQVAFNPMVSRRRSITGSLGLVVMNIRNSLGFTFSWRTKNPTISGAR